MTPCEKCEEYGDLDCKHCYLGNPCIDCTDYDPVNDTCTSKGACMVILPIETPELELADWFEDTDRGDKGFGSSGK